MDYNKIESYAGRSWRAEFVSHSFRTKKQIGFTNLPNATAMTVHGVTNPWRSFLQTRVKHGGRIQVHATKNAIFRNDREIVWKWFKSTGDTRGKNAQNSKFRNCVCAFRRLSLPVIYAERVQVLDKRIRGVLRRSSDKLSFDFLVRTVTSSSKWQQKKKSGLKKTPHAGNVLKL